MLREFGSPLHLVSLMHLHIKELSLEIPSDPIWQAIIVLVVLSLMLRFFLGRRGSRPPRRRP